MSVKLNPYLSFKDNAKEAMEFYRSIFGGELTLSTFKEFKAAQTPAEENLIMHAELNNGKGINFMSSDTPSRMAYQQGNNFNMSISGDDEDLLRSYFEKLSADGKITMPFEKAIWGDIFGMCVDKFGVQWLIDVVATK